MVIYNHSRYLNIAFWGVVLGELISLAHDFHFTKGLLWKFSAAIPENLGTLISFVCGAILWMYLQQAWANHKVFKTVSISSLIAMEGLFCLCGILADKNLDWESASDGATLSFILVLFLFFAYLVINLYVGIVLIVGCACQTMVSSQIALKMACIGRQKLSILMLLARCRQRA